MFCLNCNASFALCAPYARPCMQLGTSLHPLARFARLGALGKPKKPNFRFSLRLCEFTEFIRLYCFNVALNLVCFVLVKRKLVMILIFLGPGGSGLSSMGGTPSRNFPPYGNLNGQPCGCDKMLAVKNRNKTCSRSKKHLVIFFPYS